ncbi:unnamed protein product [Cuscuta epithymum]|uniref:Uncharacterized protein n=1 Tax=Cuscuta epithymum TaxID=186058 RepID=A0AAV0BYL1_9ASTE|nr:unnamed protein product [Cuscuta epithymum]
MSSLNPRRTTRASIALNKGSDFEAKGSDSEAKGSDLRLKKVNLRLTVLRTPLLVQVLMSLGRREKTTILLVILPGRLLHGIREVILRLTVLPIPLLEVEVQISLGRREKTKMLLRL